MRRIIKWGVGLASLLGLIFITSISAAVQLENHDPFCASCHTEPESTFVVRSQLGASDLASAHAHTELAVRCIDCHSGRGIPGRTHSLQQGTLDLITYLSGDFQQPNTTQHPIGDPGCTKCHTQPTSADLESPTSEQSSLQSKSHYHLLSYTTEWQTRTNNANGSCAVCHVAHTENTLASQQFTPRPAVNAACEACHIVLEDWVAP